MSRIKAFFPSLSTREMCIWPLFPGNPWRGLAMKAGVMPCLVPMDFTTYLVDVSRLSFENQKQKTTYLNRPALSAMSLTSPNCSA